MDIKKKDQYNSPKCEELDVNTEGVVVLSGGRDDNDPDW